MEKLRQALLFSNAGIEDIEIFALTSVYIPTAILPEESWEGANKRGNSSRLTQSFHFFMFEPIFSPVNALNQPI
ncbi:hypothetical protein CV604_005039 [Escherichia coli]|nr:hypothetical protein [Escherichia coli]